MRREYVSGPEGWEESIQVNLLSTVLLGLLLLPKLRSRKITATPPARLTFVSSGTFKHVRADQFPGLHASETKVSILRMLNDPSTFTRKQYPVTKLLLQHCISHLAALTRHDNGVVDVVINSVGPGLCRTSLTRDFSGFLPRMFVGLFYWLFGRTAEEGSRSLVSATLLGEESHGQFWQHDGFPE